MKIIINAFKDFYFDEKNIIKYALEHYHLKDDRYEIVSMINDENSNAINITLLIKNDTFSENDFIDFVLEKCRFHLKYKKDNSIVNFDEYLFLLTIFKKLDKNFKTPFDESKLIELNNRKKIVKEEQVKSMGKIFDEYNKKIDSLVKSRDNEINKNNKKYALILEDIDKQIKAFLDI